MAWSSFALFMRRLAEPLVAVMTLPARADRTTARTTRIVASEVRRGLPKPPPCRRQLSHRRAPRRLHAADEPRAGSPVAAPKPPPPALVPRPGHARTSRAR